MDFLSLFLLAVGLSMDAFAVSICKGLALKKIRFSHALIVGLWFGGFQALMPLIGYFLGAQFKDAIAAYDHWIAFGLLALIGGNMIREAVFEKEQPETDSALSFRSMLLLAIATSIDALAVGVTFAFLDVNIWSSVALIGVTTCVLSMIGVKVGSVFGAKYEKRAEIVGGVILILLGLKILLEHLGVL
ncbi:MAG: manganese efflux pump [Clostridia bacterium]|nr:manganese efflux pump [Clostridia bacterium]MBR0406804.1 manganese efflux pump [Clostridia bacterium]